MLQVSNKNLEINVEIFEGEVEKRATAAVIMWLVCVLWESILWILNIYQ
jgi:hypothetical protein